MYASAIVKKKSSDMRVIQVSSRFSIFFKTKVRRVPEMPKPKSAVLIINDPKFDQLPTEKTRIMKSS